ncbi:MAG: LUD domain-containing protein [Myxococcales bacterium]
MGASSREAILRALRATTPRPVALPDLPATGIRFPDVAARFMLALTEVGGAAVRIPSAAGLEAELQKLPAYRDARRVAACVPGVAKANVDLSRVADPHELAALDFAVLPGELGVAESGAVWVLEEKIQPRAVAFLAQHIALVLSAGALVHNLHEAYARIAMPRQGFGMWLSGPSKTADIEQALVIGAHGPRSCTAILVG